LDFNTQIKNLFVDCLEKCKCKFEEKESQEKKEIGYIIEKDNKNISFFDINKNNNISFHKFLFDNYIIISFLLFIFALYLKFTKTKIEKENNYLRKIKQKTISINESDIDFNNDYTEILLNSK
jgi:hypothetical protein